MRRIIISALCLLLCVGTLSAALVRTVVFMQKATQPGQDIFIKGGHDAGLVPNPYPSMSEPIIYLNTKNSTTAAIKANDASLDWGTESALDWTCNSWPASWGTKRTYANDGYGEDPENKWGLHWWKFDVKMDGATGNWYEFKAFMREGTSEWWESNRSQSGTPYSTINHWGKMGYITRCAYNQNWVEFIALGGGGNQAPSASFTVSPGSGTTATTFQVNASASSDPEGTTLQYRWDWDNNGTYDTSWSTSKTASKKYTSTGTRTIRLQVKDGAGLTASTTRSVTVTSGSVTVNDFRKETIYFVLTTRFYDGYSGNNYYNRDRIKSGDPHWRGDFKGLIQKLDYIKNLGFTAIWITPPVENRSGLDYHGYHAYDWNKIDPRLESPGATFQDLINAVHAKGMKLVMDVVINHSCNYGIRGKVWIDRLPIKYFRPAGTAMNDPDWADWPYSNNLGDYMHPYREDNDNPVAPSWFRARQTSDPNGTMPLVDPKTGQTVGPGYDANRFFGTDANNLNATWYHQNGFMAGGDWENPGALQSKHMAGDCIDLNTGNSTVKNYLNSAIRKWLAMGVDAIRLDTVKHIERNEMLTYINNWKAAKPGLFVFGENLVKGTGYGDLFGDDNGPSQIRPWWYTRTGNDPYNPQGNSGFSVLDFSMFSTFRDNVTRGNFNQLGMIFARDWVYADPTMLVTFFQNHDVGPDNDFKYRFGGEDYKAALVYNLLWTVRGIPCLYYGEECKFQGGKPQDISGNSDTIDQTGRAYYGPKFSTAPSHNLYKHIQRLNQIRKAVPALQAGQMSHVGEWGSGLRFVRDYNNGASYAVVGLATGGQTITVSGVRNGTYRDCITGGTKNVSNGTISFYVNGTSAGIWVLNGPGKIGNSLTWLR